MGKNSGSKGRYICKVGFYDVYAKNLTKKDANGKEMVTSVEYLVYHSKKMVEKGLKTKDLAVTKALDLLGKKYRGVYNL
jgi:hypothetical protein